MTAGSTVKLKITGTPIIPAVLKNQLDVVHLPFIHHNTIGRGNKTVVNGPKVELIEGGLITSANNDVDEGQTPKSSDECVIKSTYLKFLFPNLWMNHISDKMKIIIYFAPVDDENTILYIRFYSRAAGNKAGDACITFFGRFGNRIIERQDKRILITQKPKASSYPFPGEPAGRRPADHSVSPAMRRVEEQNITGSTQCFFSFAFIMFENEQIMVALNLALYII